LLGSGPSAPTITNITYSGFARALGTFADAAGPPVLGLSSGAILSSGSIHNIDGPNDDDAISVSNFPTPGDADLNGISVFTTFDAAVLEFDFECTDIDRVSFRYVFGSDEYNEWVNTNFNDPFGFFLNGANIALLPGGGGPVSVTNVSLVNNSAFFINNDITDFGIPTPHDVQADGFTVVLIAEAPINAGVNHIKLAIADAGDTILDSWVMIEGGSFNCGSISQNTPPEITVPNDIEVEATGPGGATVPYDTSATDAEDGDLSDDVVCVPAGNDFALGVTEVTCTLEDSEGESATANFEVTVVDTTDPVATCDETVNPSGKNVPKAGKNAGKSGQNPDGYYVLGGTDGGSGVASVELIDDVSGAAFTFAAGTSIKLTQAPGVTPNIKPGAGDTDWKVKFNGDGTVLVTDVAGNTATAACLVPKPPK